MAGRRKQMDVDTAIAADAPTVPLLGDDHMREPTDRGKPEEQLAPPEHEPMSSPRALRRPAAVSPRSRRKQEVEDEQEVEDAAPDAEAVTPRACKPTGPPVCERCVKLDHGPPLPYRCFARIAERCFASDGANDATAKWHHVSAVEHYCHDCVDYYSRGEARKLWQSEQAHGKCNFREFVVRRHLPAWVRCSRPECAKWRSLPPHATQAEDFDPQSWTCAEGELIRGLSDGSHTHHSHAQRARRKVRSTCEVAQAALASVPEPAEEDSTPVPFVSLGATENEVWAPVVREGLGARGGGEEWWR